MRKWREGDVDETVFLVYNYPCTQSVEYEPFMTSIIVLPVALATCCRSDKERFTLQCHANHGIHDPPTYRHPRTSPIRLLIIIALFGKYTITRRIVTAYGVWCALVLLSPLSLSTILHLSYRETIPYQQPHLRMKYILITLSLAGLAFSTPTSPLAPLSKRGEVIDDSYIVVLKKDVNPQQMALHLAGLEEWHSADVRLPSFFPFFLPLGCCSLAAQG
jgi:hypothetical protein